MFLKIFFDAVWQVEGVNENKLKEAFEKSFANSDVAHETVFAMALADFDLEGVAALEIAELLGVDCLHPWMGTIPPASTTLGEIYAAIAQAQESG